MPRAAAAFWTLFIVILLFPSTLVTSGAGFLVVLLHRLANRVIYIPLDLCNEALHCSAPPSNTVIPPRSRLVNIFLGIFSIFK